MLVIISNILEIVNPTKEIKDYCTKNLVFNNPEYIKKKKLGFWIGRTAKTIKLYDLYNDRYYLPLGCFEDIFRIHPIIEDYRDYTTKVTRNITSNIILRNYQEPCIKALKKHVNGIFLLPPGTGKTQIALQCASELKQHTLFLTHTRELLNQAKDRCETNLACTTSTITEGKCDTKGDMVFATVQTLSNIVEKEEIGQDEFGMIVVDECHHLATNAESVTMFEKCINYFTARYKIGLTATLHRADGLEKTTEKILGSVIYELRKEGSEFVGYYENEPIVRVPLVDFQVPAKVYIKNTQYKPSDECFDRSDRIVYTKLISSLATDYDRNLDILDLCSDIDGYTIIVSDRVDQLIFLQEHLDSSVRIDSQLKKSKREKLVEDFRKGNYKFLLATYGLIAEGFDVPMLENIILATPIKDSRLVIQSIGRCQRPYKGKEIANVYDFYDNVSILHNAYKERMKIYKKEEWEVIKESE